MLNITVIIPTYRRPADLKRCLEALKCQNRTPNKVIVTVRDTDTETWIFFQNFNYKPLNLSIITVLETGVVAAMNAGLAHAQSDIISFTDDDAAPHPDWLERIEAHFLADEKIAGVGGRDIIYRDDRLIKGEKQVVGKLQWFGRVVGNHHLGVGKAREVDVLKGVNMSFRQAAIGQLFFEREMKGTGAQVHFELAFCLSLKKAGWKLVYDPNILVDHYGQQRFDEDRREKFSDIAVTNKVHNETLALLNYFSPINNLVFLIWATLVGTRDNRGLLQCLRFLPKEGFISIKQLSASLRGRYLGWQTWKNSSSNR